MIAFFRLGVIFFFFHVSKRRRFFVLLQIGHEAPGFVVAGFIRVIGIVAEHVRLKGHAGRNDGLARVADTLELSDDQLAREPVVLLQRRGERVGQGLSRIQSHFKGGFCFIAVFAGHRGQFALGDVFNDDRALRLNLPGQ